MSGEEEDEPSVFIDEFADGSPEEEPSDGRLPPSCDGVVPGAVDASTVLTRPDDRSCDNTLARSAARLFCT